MAVGTRPLTDPEPYSGSMPRDGAEHVNDGGSRPAFPHDPADFDADPRISWSRLDNKYILENADDGSEWEWNEHLAKWAPVVDDDELARQGEAYRVAGVDEAEPAVDPRKNKKKKAKRRRGDVEGENGDQNGDAVDGEEGTGGKKPKREEPGRPERKNTAVYVTSLPLDVTVEQVHEVFSRYGVIAEEIESSAPRIKLYTDESGAFKGDALVVYFRAESVQLAIQLLDDSDFRLGQSGPDGRMRVREAERSYKKQQEAPVKQSNKAKRKIIQKTQMLNDRLADWDDDDGDEVAKAETDAKKKKASVVVLKHMFTQKELADDAAAILDIKEDIRDECSKLGEITNVVLYDKEEAGVVCVRFREEAGAKACVQLMAGRHFAGREVVAYIADGSERFKKTGERKFDEEDDEDGEESKRLDEFGSWLERDGADGS